MLGKGEIINGFQTGSLIRMNDSMKLILFVGDYLNNEYYFQKDVQKTGEIIGEEKFTLEMCGNSFSASPPFCNQDG